MTDSNLNQADFNRKIELESSTKFISRSTEEFGDATIIQHQATKQRFLLKEKCFSDRFTFLEELNKAKNRKSLVHANILKFVDYSSITKIDLAEQSYKIRLFFEHISENLTREINHRSEMGLDFPLEEITYLIYDTISACAYLQDKNLNHGDLCSDIILRTDDGHFVIGDRLKSRTRFPQNLIDRYIRGERLYLSPELYSFIKNRNGEAIESMNCFTNDVFILGLCILEAGICKDVTDVFRPSNFTIDKELLAEFIAIFELRYGGTSLPFIVLTKMLEIDPTRRPDFLALKIALPPYKDVIMYFQSQHDKPLTKRPMNVQQKVNSGKNHKVTSDAESFLAKHNPKGKQQIFDDSTFKVNQSEILKVTEGDESDFFRFEIPEKKMLVSGHRQTYASHVNTPPINEERRQTAQVLTNQTQANVNHQQFYTQKNDPLKTQQQSFHQNPNQSNQHGQFLSNQSGTQMAQMKNEMLNRPHTNTTPNMQQFASNQNSQLMNKPTNFFGFDQPQNNQTFIKQGRSDSSNIIGSSNQQYARNQSDFQQKNNINLNPGQIYPGSSQNLSQLLKNTQQSEPNILIPHSPKHLNVDIYKNNMQMPKNRPPLPKQQQEDFNRNNFQSTPEQYQKEGHQKPTNMNIYQQTLPINSQGQPMPSFNKNNPLMNTNLNNDAFFKNKPPQNKVENPNQGTIGSGGNILMANNNRPQGQAHSQDIMKRNPVIGSIKEMSSKKGSQFKIF